MSDKLRLNRNQLKAICGDDQRAIVTLEHVLARVDTTPTTIEEAVAQANQAIVMAAQALALVAELTESLEALAAASVLPAAVPLDETAPVVQLGTMSSQNDDHVDITGGTVDGVSITTRIPITLNVPPGLAPLFVDSSTRVLNLNAEFAGIADGLSSPSTFPADATDLPTALDLVNALRAAAITKGL